MYRHLSSAVLSLTLILLLTTAALAGTGLPPFDASAVPAQPDYATRSAWLAQPDDTGRYAVDVFWVYPTVLHDDTHWLMDTSDPAMKNAANNTLTTQAAVFSGQTNVYAPMYRQMNMAGLSLSEEKTSALMQYGLHDVWQAFNYYLTHLNKGRPFILAGHSQGSNLLVMMAVEHWGKTKAEDKLVAAYTLGWSITPNDLAQNPALSICENATQTGCFITYNTVAEGRQKVAPTIKNGSFVVNPLTWKTNGEFAPAKLNSGAVFFAEDGTSTTVPHFTSAQVHDSGLVVQPADPNLVPTGHTAFPSGVYHRYDYSLFFNNLKTNVSDRIGAYSSNHK